MRKNYKAWKVERASERMNDGCVVFFSVFYIIFLHYFRLVSRVFYGMERREANEQQQSYHKKKSNSHRPRWRWQKIVSLREIYFWKCRRASFHWRFMEVFDESYNESIYQTDLLKKKPLYPIDLIESQSVSRVAVRFMCCLLNMCQLI